MIYCSGSGVRLMAIRGTLMRAASVCHPHITHCEQGPWIQRRDLRFDAYPWRECSARIAAAIDRLREDRVSALVFGLDDDVIRFGSGDAEFIDGHRLHILPVRCNDGEFQSRYTHIEDAHRRAVDESQPNTFAS